MRVHIPDRLVTIIDRVTQTIYRVSRGRVGHRQLRYHILLLTTTGRKTGQPRVHALAYMPDGARLIVVASNNGLDYPPAWYLNLCAHPRVHVQRGRRHADCIARTATAEERPALWTRLVELVPFYRDHQARTRREIPVVILEPLTA